MKMSTEPSDRYFDRVSETWSGRYDRDPVFRARRSFFVRLLSERVEAGARVLDIGCGTADIATELATLGACVVGIDRSRTMIEAARAAYPELADPPFALVNADIYHLPFGDGSADHILCSSVLEYIEGEDRALDEIHRSLAEDGWAFVSVPNRQSVFRTLERLLFRPRTMLAGLLRKRDRLGDLRRLQLRKHQHDAASFATLAESSGLSIAALRYFGMPRLAMRLLAPVVGSLEVRPRLGTMMLLVLSRTRPTISSQGAPARR